MSNRVRDSVHSFSRASYNSSSSSSTSLYPSSCSSISPPRTYQLSSVSPPPRRSHRPQAQPHEHRARDHLASLIRKHGPPTPVSSTSSLRKLTSTSPINSSLLPPPSFDTPPASPTVSENPYVSTSGTRPIPIPRANSNRSLEDLPLTPLTGRFDQGLYLPREDLYERRPSRNEKPTRKKKSRPTPTQPPVASSSSRSHSTKKMQSAHGPSLTMPPHSGRPLSPQRSPKISPMYLENLPRFHPAVYQSPNNSPNNPPQSPSSPGHQRSGYRVSSGASRDALRQYRELVAASVSLPRNAATPGFANPSKPRLDPLGSPGPVTPLALEEAESYMAAKSASRDKNTSQGERITDRDYERYASSRSKDTKGW